MAANAKRKESSSAKAAQQATEKKARIDESSNQAVDCDRSEELTTRVEFTSETHVAMDPQPTAITSDLKGSILGKLTYDEETKIEAWDVGRVKDVVALSVTGPGPRRPGAAQHAHHQVADRADRSRPRL